MIKKEIGENIKIKNKKIAVIGLTYKPNVSDIRNSLALKIFNKLRKKYKNIVGFDPILDKKIAKKINITQNFNKIKNSNIIIVLVNHNIVKKKLIFFSKPNKMIINPFNYCYYSSNLVFIFYYKKRNEVPFNHFIKKINSKNTKY